MVNAQKLSYYLKFHFYSMKFSNNFSNTSANFASKKKFNLSNTFSFQNEFKQKLEDIVRSERIVSSDLLSNNEFKQQRRSPISKKEKSKPMLKYQGEILFGVHPVYLALLQKKRIFYHLYIRKFDVSEEGLNKTRKEEILEMAKSIGIAISYIDSKGLKILTSDAIHQGICLDAGFLPLPVWDDQDSSKIGYEEAEMPLWLVLDEILDPMNVGAIIRSAYYFGINKIFVVKGNSCKLSPTVGKASSGALEIIDIYQLENLEKFIQVKKNNGWYIVSTSAYLETKQNSNNLITSALKFNITKPIILILGNEGRGVSAKVESLCDNMISVEPGQILHKGMDSLNVSVAAGILFYVLKSMKNRKN